MRPWRTASGRRDLSVGTAGEFLDVLRRGSLDARRLASAIERTKAQEALARGDLSAFCREVTRAASSLWCDSELPYQIAWGLEVIGVSMVRRDRPLGLTG